MKKKSSYSLEELLQCAHGETIEGGNARLPTPNMLMMDRITQINSDGGDYGKGLMIAELDIRPELWFFDCHFQEDPVMPGCLGLDAMWQLVGFFIGWSGHQGKGRATGVNEVKFKGQVLPDAKTVTYEIHMRRLISRSFAMGVADGKMAVDGRNIYTAKGLKVGMFTSIEDFDSQKKEA